MNRHSVYQAVQAYMAAEGMDTSNLEEATQISPYPFTSVRERAIQSQTKQIRALPGCTRMSRVDIIKTHWDQVHTTLGLSEDIPNRERVYAANGVAGTNLTITPYGWWVADTHDSISAYHADMVYIQINALHALALLDGFSESNPEKTINEIERRLRDKGLPPGSAFLQKLRLQEFSNGMVLAREWQGEPADADAVRRLDVLRCAVHGVPGCLPEKDTSYDMLIEASTIEGILEWGFCSFGLQRIKEMLDQFEDSSVGNVSRYPPVRVIVRDVHGQPKALDFNNMFLKEYLDKVDVDNMTFKDLDFLFEFEKLTKTPMNLYDGQTLSISERTAVRAMLRNLVVCSEWYLHGYANPITVHA